MIRIRKKEQEKHRGDSAQGLSALLYLVFVLFFVLDAVTPGAREKRTALFGATPFGIDVDIVTVWVGLIVLAPVYFLSRCIACIAMSIRESGNQVNFATILSGIVGEHGMIRAFLIIVLAFSYVCAIVALADLL
jgi:hypothetical protein